MSECNLAARQCVPCQGGVPRLTGETLRKFHEMLDAGWQLAGEHHIEKTYAFPNWSRAMVMANKISAIAEEQNHHPDLEVAWGKCKVTIWTHKIDGLTESDFIFAAKVEEAGAAGAP